MRKSLTIKLKKELLEADENTAGQDFGSDDGKIFRFTEMPALKLEAWYIKLYSVIYKEAGAEEKKALQETKDGQSAALAVNSVPRDEALMNRVSGQLEYINLLNEFFECYEIYEPAADRYIKLNKDNISDYVDGLVAIRYLRDRAAKESLKNFM